MVGRQFGESSSNTFSQYLGNYMNEIPVHGCGQYVYQLLPIRFTQ